jgi:two-component system, chemotaxis family, CheB/CheR fusion protein
MESKSPGNRGTQETESIRVDGSGFPVVGVGASAGGLEAFASFFRQMPKNTGMAFILIQHIEPSHVSNMVDLIQKYTPMPVIEVKDQVKVEPNHVYMIPQDRATSISDRILKLSEPTGNLLGHSIDPFFRSLAQDLKDQAICVILSGTASDGTIGARAIKAEAGLVLVQDPQDARYDGMPRSAIDAGLADFILPADKMAAKLMEYVHDSYGKPAERRRKALETSSDSLKKIFALIKSRTKRDFSGYKTSTINRRIERRMSLNKIDNVEDYIRLLQENKEEVQALLQDFLIQVTSFFRDPEAFMALKKHLKDLIAGKKPEEEIRAWTAGCSTGEEAYSIAITIQEVLEELKRSPKFQVFATDLDASGIAFARLGLYQESMAADISPEYLAKYFTKKDHHYQVNKELREKVVFAVHDIIGDAPFSRIDLASARNILIYLDAATQKKVLPMFHYALNEGGLLFLGTAETTGELNDLFLTLDRKWKIYQARKKDSKVPPEIAQDLIWQRTTEGRNIVPVQGSREEVEAEKILLRALRPAVLIDNSQHILFVHGQTGRYLELKPGKLSQNLVDMAREGIRIPLSTAIYQALSQHQEVVREGIRLKINGDTLRVKITVVPVDGAKPEKLIVVFEDVVEPKAKKRLKGSAVEMEGRNRALEQELQFTRENLKSTVEELETANEELRSTLEEYQSTNEELHSTNEELETSKEELQSVNEELNTINNEHQQKIEELSTVNDDMKNLLNSTNVASVYVDEQQHIQRFTPTATKILHLMDRDIGRPIGDITSLLKSESLSQKVEKVQENLVPIVEEVQTKDGLWYSLRVYPYRTIQNAIAGVVLSFLDINQQKTLQKELTDSLAYVNSIMDTMREPMVVLDGKLKVISVNQAFYRTFKVKPEGTEGRKLYDLGNGQWNIPELRKLLEEILPQNSHLEDYSVKHDFPGLGQRTILLNARRLTAEGKGTDKILLALDDVTGQSQRVSGK